MSVFKSICGQFPDDQEREEKQFFLEVKERGKPLRKWPIDQVELSHTDKTVILRPPRPAGIELYIPAAHIESARVFSVPKGWKPQSRRAPKAVFGGNRRPQ